MSYLDVEDGELLLSPTQPQQEAFIGRKGSVSSSSSRHSDPGRFDICSYETVRQLPLSRAHEIAKSAYYSDRHLKFLHQGKSSSKGEKSLKRSRHSLRHEWSLRFQSEDPMKRKAFCSSLKDRLFPQSQPDVGHGVTVNKRLRAENGSSDIHEKRKKHIDCSLEELEAEAVKLRLVKRVYDKLESQGVTHKKADLERSRNSLAQIMEAVESYQPKLCDPRIAFPKIPESKSKFVQRDTKYPKIEDTRLPTCTKQKDPRIRNSDENQESKTKLVQRDTKHPKVEDTSLPICTKQKDPRIRNSDENQESKTKLVQRDTKYPNVEETSLPICTKQKDPRIRNSDENQEDRRIKNINGKGTQPNEKLIADKRKYYASKANEKTRLRLETSETHGRSVNNIKYVLYPIDFDKPKAREHALSSSVDASPTHGNGSRPAEPSHTIPSARCEQYNKNSQELSLSEGLNERTPRYRSLKPLITHGNGSSPAEPSHTIPSARCEQYNKNFQELSLSEGLNERTPRYKSLIPLISTDKKVVWTFKRNVDISDTTNIAGNTQAVTTVERAQQFLLEGAPDSRMAVTSIASIKESQIANLEPSVPVANDKNQVIAFAPKNNSESAPNGNLLVDVVHHQMQQSPVDAPLPPRDITTVNVQSTHIHDCVNPPHKENLLESPEKVEKTRRFDDDVIGPLSAAMSPVTDTHHIVPRKYMILDSLTDKNNDVSARPPRTEIGNAEKIINVGEQTQIVHQSTIDSIAIKKIEPSQYKELVPVIDENNEVIAWTPETEQSLNGEGQLQKSHQSARQPASLAFKDIQPIIYKELVPVLDENNEIIAWTPETDTKSSKKNQAFDDFNQLDVFETTLNLPPPVVAESVMAGAERAANKDTRPALITQKTASASECVRNTQDQSSMPSEEATLALQLTPKSCAKAKTPTEKSNKPAATPSKKIAKSATVMGSIKGTNNPIETLPKKSAVTLVSANVDLFQNTPFALKPIKFKKLKGSSTKSSKLAPTVQKTTGLRLEKDNLAHPINLNCKKSPQNSAGYGKVNRSEKGKVDATPETPRLPLPDSEEKQGTPNHGDAMEAHPTQANIIKINDISSKVNRDIVHLPKTAVCPTAVSNSKLEPKDGFPVTELSRVSNSEILAGCDLTFERNLFDWRREVRVKLSRLNLSKFPCLDDSKLTYLVTPHVLKLAKVSDKRTYSRQERKYRTSTQTSTKLRKSETSSLHGQKTKVAVKKVNLFGRVTASFKDSYINAHPLSKDKIQKCSHSKLTSKDENKVDGKKKVNSIQTVVKTNSSKCQPVLIGPSDSFEIPKEKDGSLSPKRGKVHSVKPPLPAPKSLCKAEDTDTTRSRSHTASSAGLNSAQTATVPAAAQTSLHVLGDKASVSKPVLVEHKRDSQIIPKKKEDNLSLKRKRGDSGKLSLSATKRQKVQTESSAGLTTGQTVTVPAAAPPTLAAQTSLHVIGERASVIERVHQPVLLEPEVDIFIIPKQEDGSITPKREKDDSEDFLLPSPDTPCSLNTGQTATVLAATQTSLDVAGVGASASKPVAQLNLPESNGDGYKLPKQEDGSLTPKQEKDDAVDLVIPAAEASLHLIGEEASASEPVYQPALPEPDEDIYIIPKQEEGSVTPKREKDDSGELPLTAPESLCQADDTGKPHSRVHIESSAALNSGQTATIPVAVPATPVAQASLHVMGEKASVIKSVCRPVLLEPKRASYKIPKKKEDGLSLTRKKDNSENLPLSAPKSLCTIEDTETLHSREKIAPSVGLNTGPTGTIPLAAAQTSLHVMGEKAMVSKPVGQPGLLEFKADGYKIPKKSDRSGKSPFPPTNSLMGEKVSVIKLHSTADLSTDSQHLPQQPPSALTQHEKEIPIIRGNWTDFVSDDPQENADNNDERWDRDRSRDRAGLELYRHINSKWKNLSIPNPWRNLTFRHNSNKRHITASTQPIQVVPGRRSCVEMYTSKINQIKEEKSKALLRLKEKQAMERKDLERRQERAMYNCARNSELFNIQQYERHLLEMQALNRVHRREHERLCRKPDDIIAQYSQYQHELRTFYNFYVALEPNRRAHMHTEDQFIQTETMLNLYNVLYK